MLNERLLSKILSLTEYFIKLLPQLAPAALLLGSIPFFVYFYTNDFFPNIELFNWISLLSFSFILSLLSLIALTVFWTFPGAWWKTSIANNYEIKRKFFICDQEVLDNENYYQRIMINYLIYPFFILELIDIFLILIEYENNNFIAIINPIITAIFTTIILFYKLKLSVNIFYFLKNLSCLFYSLLFLHMNFLFIIKLIEENINIENYWLGLTALVTVIVISLISIFIQYSKIPISIAITTIFTLFLLSITNKYPTLSGRLMKNLHVGNYQAEQIYLTQEACQRLQSIRLLNITENCSLQNITVLWSMGDQYVLKVPVKETSELVFLKTQDVILLQKKIDQTKEPSSHETNRH
ncbi:MAG: hypothetical protein AB2993_07035 [Candidatus Symbiodolus clandestinus]